MKKLSQILAIMAILLAPLAASGTAFAAGTCQVGYTGPDSNNLCIATTTYTCSVNNVTHLATVTSNNQTAISGVALVEGNTQGGSSSTGSATNNNNVTFNVTVTNSIEGGGVCTVAATVPATPVTPKGDGGGQVTAPNKTAPAVLPNTSGDEASGYLVVLATTLGIGSIASYLVATIYRHQKS